VFAVSLKPSCREGKGREEEGDGAVGSGETAIIAMTIRMIKRRSCGYVV
jgi:hypothetical protein